MQGASIWFKHSLLHVITLTQEAITATLEGRDSLLILPTGKYDAEAAVAFNCHLILFVTRKTGCYGSVDCYDDVAMLLTHTGGGKSLTFQLPALAKGNGFTVVIGPLMALAKDQVCFNWTACCQSRCRPSCRLMLFVHNCPWQTQWELHVGRTYQVSARVAVELMPTATTDQQFSCW